MENLIWSGFYKHIDFNIDYDLYEPYVVKQYDTRSRGLYVQIIQNGLVIAPSASNSLTFFAVKPDGTEIAELAVIENGLFRVDFPNQALSVAGEMKGELALRGANNEVITKSITVTIEPSLELQGVESTDDFSALQQALSQTAGFAGEIQDVQLFAENIQRAIGNMEELSTDEKESIVNSINELNNKINDVLGSENLDTLLNTKVDKETLGDMSLLATDEKTVLVTAINELFANVEEIRSVSDVSILLPLLNSKAEKTTVGNLADLVDFEQAETPIENLVDAINYVYEELVTALDGMSGVDLEGLALSEDLGDKEELTTDDKTNLVNAINEINAALKTVESVTNVEQLSLLLSGKADKSSLGNLSELTTVQKNNIVAAINEINAIIDGLGDVDFTEIYGLIDGLQTNIDNIQLTPGPKGDPGQDGEQGEQGPQGEPGLPGQPGADGLSAYQIWLNAGNSGTEQDFLDSLKVVLKTIEGLSGGANSGSLYTSASLNIEVLQSINVDSIIVDVGILSNYSLFIDNKLIDTVSNSVGETTFKMIDSLLGPGIYNIKIEATEPVKMKTINIDPFIGKYIKMNTGITLGATKFNSYYLPIKLKIIEAIKGEKGEPGLSAYQIWLDAGNTGTEQDFLQSLEGPQGPPGEGSGGGLTLEDLPNKGSISHATDTGDTTNAHIRQVNVSQDSRAISYRSQINASYDSEVVGSGAGKQINVSSASINSGVYSQINASKGVSNTVGYSVAMGYDEQGLNRRHESSPHNIKIHLLSQTGDINHSGVLNSGHNFTDYAELFPNLTNEEQGYGLIQTVEGHGVRPANSGDQVVGVTSATAGVILGETSFSWADRWLKDEWGAYIMEDVVDEDWKPREGQTEEDRPVHRLPKENPDYDPEREYVKRQERPDEWTVVGLVGQVYVRLDENVEPMDYVKPLKDGVGQTSSEPTNIRVMKITQEFDEDKGYQIGFCLLK